MRGILIRYGMAAICLAAAIWMWLPAPGHAQSQGEDGGGNLPALLGYMVNAQRQPIADAEVSVYFDGGETPAVGSIFAEPAGK